ncbi:MAG: hypothetical protein LBR94_01355 [Desulfovibrio sp.]|jgi:hypothetical protein|nr:hypothetical protein [Desulfovibrio sp.]
MSKSLLFAWAALLLTLGFADFALAADVDVLGQISNAFYQKAGSWSTTLEKIAFNLFYWFILLDICLFGIRGVLDLKTGAPVAGIAGEFANFILFAAFMYVCIKYYKKLLRTHRYSTSYILAKTLSYTSRK